MCRYGAEGFFLGKGGELRCRCSRKACYGKWDRSTVLRHINGVVHQRMLCSQVRMFNSIEEAAAALGPRFKRSVLESDSQSSGMSRATSGCSPSSNSFAQQAQNVVSSSAKSFSPASIDLTARRFIQTPIGELTMPIPATFLEPQGSVLWQPVDVRKSDGTVGRR